MTEPAPKDHNIKTNQPKENTMTEFHNFVRDFKAGHLDAQLSNKMQELVESVIKFGKAGKLTVENNLIDSNPKQPELFERPAREVTKPSVVSKSL